jgi:hypothetical protein
MDPNSGMFYAKRDVVAQCHLPDPDRPPLVARLHACGAMARLIRSAPGHRLPARHPAGFFVPGENL